MGMTFAYRLKPFPRPVLALGGRFSRPQPLIQVTIMGPANSVIDSALLDTGSDETLFSESVARRLGIDLGNAPVSRAEGVGPVPVTARQAEVTLRLTDGTETREWKAWVGFVPGLRKPLLGFAGRLQFFTATFQGDREQFELTVNALYPGT